MNRVARNKKISSERFGRRKVMPVRFGTVFRFTPDAIEAVEKHLNGGCKSLQVNEENTLTLAYDRHAICY